MKLVTISLPTSRILELGLFPPRFFEHNASLEVLQAFHLGGEDLTLLVRIKRKGEGPTEAEIDEQGAELRERYGLKHFELLDIDAEAKEYTVLLRVSMTEGMGEMARRLGADLLPAQPSIISEDRARASFYATEPQIARVRDLLQILDVGYQVERAKRVSGTPGALGLLTARQRDLLQLAHRLGYFDSPARTDLSRLAGIAGVSKAAVSKQLRAAQNKIVSTALGA